MNCLGRTKSSNYRRRCPNSVKWWKPYCWQHWLQPFAVIGGLITFAGVVFALVGLTVRDLLPDPPPEPWIEFEAPFILAVEGGRGFVEVTPGFVLNVTEDRSRAEVFYCLSDESSGPIKSGSIVRLISVTTGKERRVCVGGNDASDATKERLKIDGSQLDGTIASSPGNDQDPSRSQFVFKKASANGALTTGHLEYGDSITIRCVYRDAYWRLDAVHAGGDSKISHAHIVAATGGFSEYDQQHSTGDSAEDAVPRFVLTRVQQRENLAGSAELTTR